jgi:hypothetical protein
MKMLVRLLLLLAAPAVTAANDDLLTTLRETHGDYQWDVKRVVSVDLNRDGKTDSAALGLKDTKVALVIRISGLEEPIFVEIPVDASQQFGVCSTEEPQITVENQSEAPIDALGENPHGYEVCPDCFEIVVSDGDCDPLQFYWDTLANGLTWWRA